MDDILQSTQNRIAEVTALKYIDEDWGQLDSYSPHPPVKFPFALIDVSNAVYSNLGVDRAKDPINRQTAVGTITIIIGNLKLTNTSFKAPQQQKENAWSIHSLIEDVHKKLHGWRPTEKSGALIRTGRQRVISDDGVQKYRITYSIGLTDV